MIIDSINEALSRGASPDSIVQKIKASNPQKAASFDEAIKRGATSQMILDQILKQNAKPKEPETILNQTSSAKDTSAGNAYGVGDAIVQGGIGVGKSFAETLMTPAKKLSEIQETVGAGNIAEQTGLGIEQLTKQSNALNAKYLSLPSGDPMKKQILEDIKRTQKAINDMSKGLGAEKQIGDVTKERFKGLEATNTAQSVGKFLGDTAQFIAGGTAKLPSVASKVPLLGKVARTADELSRLNKAGELTRIGEIADVVSKMAQSYVKNAATFAPVSAAIEGGSLKETAKSANLAGLFGAGGEVASALMTKYFPKLSQALQKSMLRMTPAEKTKMNPKKLEEALTYAEALPLRGTPSMRYSQNLKRIEDMEWGIQQTLKQADDMGISAGGKNILGDLDALAGELSKDSANAPTIIRQIEEAANNIFRQYPDGNIPLSRLNDLKRSYASGAFDSSGMRLLSDVKYGISEVLYKHVAQELERNGLRIAGATIKDFNSLYSPMLTMNRLLKAAKNRSQTKLLTKFLTGLSAMAGIDAFIGRGMTGILSAAAIENLTTPTKSIFAPILKSAGKNAGKINKVSGAIGAMQ